MYAAFRGLQFIYRAESLPSATRMRCIQSIGKPFTSYTVVRGSPSGRHNARVGYPQVDGQYHILKLSGLNLYGILHSVNCHRSCAFLKALKGYLCNINKVWAFYALIQISFYAACACAYRPSSIV